MVHPRSVRRWSRWFAATLVGVGLIVLVLSLFMLYVGRILVRDDTFADRVTQSLDDPHVAEFVALRITDVVITQQPDLTAIRPILVVVTRGVVGSEPFRALVRRPLRQAHRALLSSTAENILLAVPDVGVLIRESLKAVGPAAAERVPERLQPVLRVETAAPAVRAAGRVLGIASLLRPYGRLGLLIAVIGLTAAIVVSPKRRTTMLSAGVGVSTVGVVLALAVPAGRVLATAVIPEAGAADAASGLWLAFFGPLRVAGIVVGVIGVAVAMAAMPLQVVKPSALRSGLWELISHRRERTIEEVGRVSAIGLAGLFALFAPGVALSVAMVVSGAILLLFAFADVRQLVQPYLPTAAHDSAEDIRVAPVAMVGIRVVVMLAVGVGAAALLLRMRPQPDVVVVASGGGCNGAVELCERPLNRVVFPGAHNAMGSAMNPAWLFPNQDLDIPGLLGRGVRAFLLDPYLGNRIGSHVKTDFDAVPHANRKIAEVIGEEAWAAGMRVREQLVGEPGPRNIYLCHGFCELGAIPLVPALRSFVDFLVTHPDEVLILDFEDYAPPGDIAKAFEESGLLAYVYRDSLGPTWPTLGEMVASGGRVVVIGEYEVTGVPWMHLAWEGLLAETPYTFPTPEDFSCRPNRGTPRGGLFLINHWIETTPTPRPSNARIVNQQDVIVGRARQCQRERRMLPNVIAVDFAGIGDVVGAARVLNGLPPQPKPR
jgi:hypothetical protein